MLVFSTFSVSFCENFVSKHKIRFKNRELNFAYMHTSHDTFSVGTTTIMFDKKIFPLGKYNNGKLYDTSLLILPF